jgi:DMSO/TMAO reductase YedYZ molybdopterin-dependent catalytic subunit
MAFDFFNHERKSRTAHADPERIPPGQVVTDKWPVLHYGGVPSVDLQRGDFQIFGEVESPLRLTWDEFQQLPRTTVRSIFGRARSGFVALNS